MYTVCGHYSLLCLWPLVRIGSTCVLIDATTVYSVFGHSYEKGVHMYTVCGNYSVVCLWPVLQIGSTHVLFVATTV